MFYTFTMLITLLFGPGAAPASSAPVIVRQPPIGIGKDDRDTGQVDKSGGKFIPSQPASF